MGLYNNFRSLISSYKTHGYKLASRKAKRNYKRLSKMQNRANKGFKRGR